MFGSSGILKGLCQATVAAALGVVAVGVTPAHATLISLGLQEAGTNGGAITTVANDGGMGGVAYSGSYGTFAFNLITAAGAPAQSSGTLDTTSIQTSSDGGGAINIFVTESGLTSPMGASNWLSSFTSNTFTGTVNSVVERTFISTSNALYGGTQLASATFTGINTSTATTAMTLAGTYSETVEYSISVGAGNASVNDTINLVPSPIPEPMTLSLMAGGLLALGAVRKRFC